MFFTTNQNIIYADDEPIIENIIESIGNETYSAPEIDLIEYYRDFPMNLRTVSASELSVLPAISLRDAENIVRIIKNNPEIKNYKLADIANLSPEAEILLDVCTINVIPDNENSFRLNVRSRIKSKLIESKGFESGAYKGSIPDIYNRLIGSYSNFEAGTLINKHSGEININEFTSAYASYVRGRNRIIIGDFFADYGFGSLLWRQFAARKGMEVITPVGKIGSGISPYRSTIDFSFFRGVAAQTYLDLSQDITAKISGFFSLRNKSASYDSLHEEISSVYTSGYYRTDSEINKKNMLSEQATAMNLEISSSHGFLLGAAVLYLKYNYPINSRSSSSFNGSSGLLKSVFSQYQSGKLELSGELSQDAEYNPNLRLNLIYSGNNFDFAMSGRYISDGFRSPYGYSFGEFSYPSNEKGIYNGLHLNFSKNFKLSFYADFFSSISATYTVPSVVRGADFFMESYFKPDRNSTLIFRLRRDTKTDVFTDEDKFRLIGKMMKNSVRIEYTNSQIDKLNMRIRSEFCMYNNESSSQNSEGFLTFIDLRYLFSKEFRLGLRYTIFSTKDFNSAIYQYEYTMPGVMQSIPLYGNGYRLIMTVNYKLLNYMKIYANFNITGKNNTDNIGSGYDMIQSDNDPRVALQVELNL